MAYTNSGLVSVKILSPHHSGQRTHKIDTITIHCMAGHLTASSCGNLFLSRDASSNYGVDDSGKVGLYVEEKNVAWTTSNSYNDNRAITIEVASDSSGECKVTDTAYKTTVKLVADICIRNHIKKLIWSKSKDVRVNHKNGCNMTVHRDYAQKSCPGDYLYNRMGDIAKQANKMIKSGKVGGKVIVPNSGDTSPAPSSSESTGSGVVSDPNDVINADAIDALLVSLTTSVKKVDYKKLLNNHVSGVLIKAGSYFTAEHKVSKRYRNRNLQTQIDGAVKAGVRFGLYVDVRAKNVAEAKKECEQLYYVVSKYPPALGLWLHLLFTKSKKTNNKIMDYYLTQMKSWGFTKGCGIYCTKKELAKIDWDKYQEDFFLWYVKRFSKDSELAILDKVLDPDFFKR